MPSWTKRCASWTHQRTDTWSWTSSAHGGLGWRTGLGDLWVESRGAYLTKAVLVQVARTAAGGARDSLYVSTCVETGACDLGGGRGGDSGENGCGGLGDAHGKLLRDSNWT